MLYEYKETNLAEIAEASEAENKIWTKGKPEFEKEMLTSGSPITNPHIVASRDLTCG
jgi:hypothetical protein